MPTLRRCRGCPALIPPTAYKGRCTTCNRAQDRDRGGRTARGYGAAIVTSPLGTDTYDRTRAAYQRDLDRGAHYLCSCGCGTIIDATSWHLAHDSDDRSIVHGPATPACNHREAGASSARTSRTHVR